MSHADTDFNDLIPELPTWNDGAGIGVEGCVQCKGSFELAVGYSRLFWPQFVEHEGCVFRAEFSPAVYRDFMQTCDGDRARVESVMNHRHIKDQFGHYDAVATAKQLIYLGQILKDIWQTKLAHDFPNRRFEVDFNEGSSDDLEGYQITFWQA